MSQKLDPANILYALKSHITANYSIYFSTKEETDAFISWIQLSNPLLECWCHCQNQPSAPSVFRAVLCRGHWQLLSDALTTYLNIQIKEIACSK